MSELDLITTIIVGWASGSAGTISAAPAQAVGEHIRERIKDRLDGTRHKGDVKAAGRPLEVSDRVAYKVLTEAAFNDDEIVSDYLGGVLAASTHGDDRASAVVATIARLSADQLKVHYVIYRAVAQLLPGPLNLHSSEECRKARVLIGNDDLIAALGPTGRKHLGSSMAALQREALIDDTWSVQALKEHSNVIAMDVEPTGLGAELFLWGHGVRQPDASRLGGNPELVFLTEVKPTPTAILKDKFGEAHPHPSS